ncbi:MAG: hypothetical protein B7Z40_18095 [Bosea sp. 12-68-7]|nr:MAG: hypothetical protein B7Z40_18095 [Bosea sp. 12-68-7]
MSEPARNRFALDLEDLERQLRSAGQAPRSGQPADPLAELTRIVDQGDPLKDIFGQRGPSASQQRAAASGPAPGAAPEASPSSATREAVRPAAPAGEVPLDAVSHFQAVAAQSPPPAELRGALDEFEALLRRNEPVRSGPAVAPVRAEPRFDDVDQGFERAEPQPYLRAAVPELEPTARDLDEMPDAHAAYAPPPSEDMQAYPGGVPADEDMPDLEPRRSRKGLYAAAALIVVGVVGVGTVMSMRGTPPTVDGQPPTITAATGPTKVEPVNPGGAEIPNQNKQIYERPGDQQSGQTKVVSREEQPIDVQQAARSLPARVILPGPGTATATPSTPPAASNALAQAPEAAVPLAAPAEPALTPVPPVPGLGEPRRVRTVSIRPDGTPAPSPNGTAGYTNGAVPLATGSAPPARPAGIVPSAPPAPAATTPARPSATPVVEAPKVQERATVPPPPSAPLRIASAQQASQAPAAPATAAVRSGTGDFVVQLAAPGSESEARATFAALQRKYPGQLGGQAPIIRKTELAGGKTVYRLRVGPYSRDDATSMCTALQAAGGQCFIAKN